MCVGFVESLIEDPLRDFRRILNQSGEGIRISYPPLQDDQQFRQMP